MEFVYSKAMYSLAVSAVYGSISLLVFLFQSNDALEPGLYFTLARITYVVPKIGLVIGLLTLLTVPRWGLRAYALCWIFGVAHTVLWYGKYLVGLESLGEFTVAPNGFPFFAQHHLVPHLFYPVMLWLVWRETPPLDRRNSTAQARKAAPAAATVGGVSKKDFERNWP